MLHEAITLDQFVGRARDLYSLPRVAARVLELTDEPGIDARALKECVENDPALVGKLLRVVNSSLFGLSREVRDLNQALALLGIKPLKLLVLGFCLPDGLLRDFAGDFLARYWERTLIKAVAAREIAQAAWRTAGDEAFLAGLLQELGMLVLLQELGVPYAHFLEKAQSAGEDWCEAERAVLGFDHTQLTQRLLAHWQLPETLVAAAALPETAQPFDRMSPTKRLLPQVLRLADLVARCLGEKRPDLLPAIVEHGVRDHGMSAEQIAALLADLQSKTDQLADVLSFELPPGRDYQEVLRRGHERLSELAAEAAGAMASRRAALSPPGQEEIALWRETQSLTAAVDSVLRPGAGRTAARDNGAAQNGRNNSAVPSAGQSFGIPPQGSVGHDGALEQLLATAAARCRAERQPLSLLLVEIDRHDQLKLQLGTERTQALTRLVDACCRQIAERNTACLPLGEASRAVVLVDCDRQAAVRLGHELLACIYAACEKSGVEQLRAARLSVGAAAVALPASNFSPRELIEAACRCLFAARAAGGGKMVKSIELH
jgi:HD-like signal output (HDOD) protein/GGDEF domain-containing protein